MLHEQYMEFREYEGSGQEIGLTELKAMKVNSYNKIPTYFYFPGKQDG